ncbi:hypothetical protein AJ80_07637 [Polytolypa hystricis UAMH7299]|uniref:Palmitoyltransferase n=1 Tax=Polytolypa hystricis (strain UAMH7299) TaxID=1447883 RepID=A0A2B7XKK0_POLH7|nr:hypothetical protein AJ80_07637 [Polytolypa hystricis UAMH7299]
MDAFASGTSDPLPPKRRPRSFARKCERVCSRIFTYFPLAFVYSLTTWAVSVEVRVGINPGGSKWIGTTTSIVGFILYLLADISYTVAVFTDPGNPLGDGKGKTGGRGNYSHLPTTETPQHSALTVSSTGGTRFCRKCQCSKPDRTHHCSTCKRCVLKMDHHCPWLATCVGLHNYKAFLLFLVYTSLFCWVCFAVSGTWTWNELLDNTEFVDTAMPISIVLLAVISGIIGLVLTGFTIWHISLAWRGLTTIECLEKTRYLAPVRQTFDRQRMEGHWAAPNASNGAPDGSLTRTLQGYGQQILDAHANAIPGVTRAEEGEERPSPPVQSRGHDPEQGRFYQSTDPYHYQTPAQQSLHYSYEEMEREREMERYEDYLNEQETEKLPNAFDLGWRRNFVHLLGEKPLLWPLPICNTTGDGWHWEPSQKWLDVKQRIEQRRLARWGEFQHQRQQQYQFDNTHYPQESRHSQNNSYRGYPPSDSFNANGGAHRGRDFNSVDNTPRPGTGVSMKTLRPMSPRPRPGEEDFDDPSLDRYSTSSDEAFLRRNGQPGGPRRNSTKGSKHRGSPTKPRVNSAAEGQQDEWRDWD